MKRLAIAVTIAAAAGTARAEPPARTLIGVGGGFPGIFFTAGEGVLDVAVRVDDRVPVCAHGMFVIGKGGREDYGGASYEHARAGAELHDCTPGGVACLVLDLDAGYLHVSGDDYIASTPYPTTRNGLMIAGRGGFDLGDESLRFRLTLDIARSETGHFTVRDGWGGDVDLGRYVALEAEIMGGF